MLVFICKQGSPRRTYRGMGTKLNVSMLSKPNSPPTKDRNISRIDKHIYKSLKKLHDVSPYQLPPYYNVLYNLGENNRVCLEILHLKESYKFEKKKIYTSKTNKG